MAQHLRNSLQERLPKQYPEDVKGHWEALKTTILKTSRDIIGFKTSKHQDWFDENDAEIQHLIDAKRKAFCTWQNDINCKAIRQAHSKAKSDGERTEKQLVDGEALEIQWLADTGDTRGLFSATKAVYGPIYQGLNPLRSKDGQSLLKDEAAISSRWREHFQELLNRNTTFEMEAINQISQRPIMEHMGDPPGHNRGPECHQKAEQRLPVMEA
ncbi:hypothetical protein N1851_028677 [Merluccius polli]|uniref:Uncharacterized protein n=1 Tax=Merluccius polli TaxID=89951 RepID=A0AA47NRB5_MERPO|nr:hypothetical protein N1851_028677 [Merluccius polli]